MQQAHTLGSEAPFVCDTPMNHSRCLKIVERIDAWLVHELGQGIDRQRMLQDAAYARDVLLVCDAHSGTAMAALAQHFRQAVREEPQPEPSAFSPSRFLNSLFGPSSKPDLELWPAQAAHSAPNAHSAHSAHRDGARQRRVDPNLR